MLTVVILDLGGGGEKNHHIAEVNVSNSALRAVGKCALYTKGGCDRQPTCPV